MLTVLKGRDINERCVSESEPSNLVAPDICFTDEREIINSDFVSIL